MHPYAGHKAQAVGKRRVKVLMRSGGYAHDDEKADKKLFSKLIAEHERGEDKHGGEKRGGRLDRYARGGRAKHKPSVHVNVIHNSHGPVVPPTLGAAGLGAGAGPLTPIGGAPGPLPPPGAVPPGMPPPGMKSGGYISGISTKENLDKWKGYARKNTRITRAAGGAVMRKGKKYGEGSGEGRLEEFHHMKGR